MQLVVVKDKDGRLIGRKDPSAPRIQEWLQEMARAFGAIKVTIEDDPSADLIRSFFQ